MQVDCAVFFSFLHVYLRIQKEAFIQEKEIHETKYIKLPYCENVQPEDIEDLSERYVPLFGAERDADTVKKVNVKNSNPFFFVSLIEYKSNLDYNVSMQIFRYMIYIWEDYEREMEHKIRSSIMKEMQTGRFQGISGTESCMAVNMEDIFL